MVVNGQILTSGTIELKIETEGKMKNTILKNVQLVLDIESN